LSSFESLLPYFGNLINLQFLIEIFPYRSIAEKVSWFILAYFLILNVCNLLLNILALTSIKSRQEKRLEELPQLHSDLQLPVSILVPAFNESVTIASSVRSLLQLSYSNYEIIVINDGSQDDTMAVLQREFALTPLPPAYQVQIPTGQVHGIFQSTRHVQLRVIDKANGGKADALNAGINLARYSLFCGVDADSVLERDCLQHMIRPFLRDPTVVATGGTVRVANGCKFKNGHLNEVALPRNFLALFQIVEYARAFFLSRLGWSALNGVLIISGAFGVFKKSIVVAVGGYRINTMGEDMELVVRIHRLLRVKRERYRIVFVPEPVCWTEAPEDFKTLRTQRIRWQRGLCESLSANWGLMLSRNPGIVGVIAFPFMVLFELMGALLEVAGFGFMAIFWAAGWVSWDMVYAFLFVSIGLGTLLSVSSLLLEEMIFHLHKTRHLAVLALFALLENFGYHQLNTYWRLIGLYRWANDKDGNWGLMKRKGAWQSAA
jgi:cellulose synthase/poly-beta-1,6-N-acetylglucosamine synthase-like glycosyltransferase